MLSDPIANMLTRIRNGYLAKKSQVVVPHSKVKEAILKVLLEKGYLKKIKNSKLKIKNRECRVLICELEYQDKEPAATKIIRLSKPSLRVYFRKNKLSRALRGRGIIIISTPKGIMTAREARKKGLGGEAICKVW